MYYVVYDIEGKLVSWGTEVATDEELSERGYTTKEFTDSDAPPSDKDWNPTTKEFDIDRISPTPEVPALTPLEVLEADPEFKAMTSTEKRLARLLVKALSPNETTP